MLAHPDHRSPGRADALEVASVTLPRRDLARRTRQRALFCVLAVVPYWSALSMAADGLAPAAPVSGMPTTTQHLARPAVQLNGIPPAVNRRLQVGAAPLPQPAHGASTAYSRSPQPAVVPTNYEAVAPAPPSALPARPRIEDVRFAQMPADAPPVASELVQPGPPSAALPSPFRSDQVRLPLLPFGSTPAPTPEMQAKYDKYIDRTIDPENVLDLVEGRPRLVVFKQVPFRVQIADESIAFYQQVTEREFSIQGQKVGSTVLNFWFADPLDPAKQEVLSYLLRVIPDPETKERLERIYEALEREINRKFPNSVVYLSLVGDRLLIEGQAKDIEEAAHILDIVGRNAPGGPETIPLENINIDVLALPNESGELPAYGLENFLMRSQSSSVINRLRVPGVQQVMLKVTVAEVNRSAARAIGANLALGELGNAVSFFSFTPQGAAGLVSDVVTGGGRLLIDRGDFKLSIDALRTLGLARALAEPNLVTLNGRTANLLVGGSFPVPQTQSFTTSAVQSVEFVPFGVSLLFTPVVVDKDRIRLSVFATISTRDEATGTTIGDSTVPGLQARSFSTLVELRDGQTLAVAGLVQNNMGAESTRVPFLGDLPLVGRIFKRDTTSYDEQELMVLVTPMLVEPLNACEQLPLPGADMFEPDDLEFYLMGNIEGHFMEDYRSSARTDWWKMRQFRQVERQFIIGPSGNSDGH